MFDILKMLGLSSHYGVTATPSFIDPYPEQAAMFCWNVIASNLWIVRSHPFPDDEAIKLHKALDSIDGSCLIPRNNECDACDFVAALSTMAQFNLVIPIRSSGLNYFDADLCSVFDRWEEIPEERIIAELLPEKRQQARRYLPRAAERMKWLASVKDKTAITQQIGADDSIPLIALGEAKPPKKPDNPLQAADSFDPKTMITISDLVTEASKQLNYSITDSWVYDALGKAGITPVFEPKQKNRSKGYPRITSLGAITAKVKTE